MKNRFINTPLTAILLLAIFALVSTGCQKNYTPKPRGYFRIDFPEKSYKTDEFNGFPYQFEQPTYSQLKQDSTKSSEPFWVNIEFPTYNGTLHLSYKKVEGNLNNLLEDNRKLTYKHTIKADAINEKLFNNVDKKVHGILFEVKGNAASPCQFFLTDSSNHFLRGSLYFNTIPNKDSIAPVVDFIKQDVIHLMETLNWK